MTTKLCYVIATVNDAETERKGMERNGKDWRGVEWKGNPPHADYIMDRNGAEWKGSEGSGGDGKGKVTPNNELHRGWERKGIEWTGLDCIGKEWKGYLPIQDNGADRSGMDWTGMDRIGQEWKTNRTTKGAIMSIDIEKRKQIKEALDILKKVLSDMVSSPLNGK